MNKELLKELLPPFAIRALKRSGLFRYGSHWKGNYKTWREAVEKSAGYDSDEIIEKVTDSLLKVKQGKAAYERDSVLFDKIEYTWPVLAGMLWVYAQENRLNIIDFGGSLGSTYFQNRNFLQTLDNVKWNIVEQPKFVEIGQRLFQNEILKFYPDISFCLKDGQPNCVLLSSVLPYICNPYEFLSELTGYKIPFLILDKMPFIEGTQDRITIQKTPKSIYDASYPAWFFSESKFKEAIKSKYSIVEEFLCRDEANIKSVHKGMILKLK